MLTSVVAGLTAVVVAHVQVELVVVAVVADKARVGVDLTSQAASGVGADAKLALNQLHVARSIRYERDDKKSSSLLYKKTMLT